VTGLKRAHESATAAVNDGWIAGSSFLGSIMAGTLVGWLADRWLDTDPWLVVIGIVAGSINGFVRMRPSMIQPTGKQAYRGR
jgi:F0F1-type ATP synthase assembly protein I